MSRRNPAVALTPMLASGLKREHLFYRLTEKLMGLLDLQTQVA